MQKGCIHSAGTSKGAKVPTRSRALERDVLHCYATSAHPLDLLAEIYLKAWRASERHPGPLLLRNAAVKLPLDAIQEPRRLYLPSLGLH